MFYYCVSIHACLCSTLSSRPSRPRLRRWRDELGNAYQQQFDDNLLVVRRQDDAETKTEVLDAEIKGVGG
jgi:hypothetical protein